MDSYMKFKKLMEDYNILLDELVRVENSKIKVISSGGNVIDELDKYLRTEEAQILKMRGLDNKREAILKEMGFAGKTFGQILELVLPEQKDELQPLCIDMKNKTESLRNLSKSTGRMLESKLMRLENAVRNNAYDQNGNRMTSEGGSRMRPTSV